MIGDIIENFSFWLESIVEDDPIPYEIKNISFVYTKTNSCFVLCMGGTEFKPNQNNIFDFFPLEAQFFYFTELNKIEDENYYKNLIKTCIDESFSSSYLKEQYNKKYIYFGEYGKKLEFLFQVEKN